MTLNEIPESRRCGAKTRAGSLCKNWSILPAGKCRMHGGRSRRGIASPRLTHGFYSKDWYYRLMWDAALRGDDLARSFVEDLVRREA